ncbi:MAG: HAMP domain-containing sensor histidine kinase [Bacillota bacterium]|nr:HAMP domain-containing sensor histidine kinase [Bacillota bacterium]
MRKLKLKIKFTSLTMRIWTTFTAVILIIILSISLYYLFAIRRTKENSYIQILKGAHEMILDSQNYDAPVIIGPERFNKNLRGESFIYIENGTGTTILDMKRQNLQQPHPDMQPDGQSPMYGLNIQDVEKWMVSYADGNKISEKQFSGYYKGKKFIFIISSINYHDSTGKSYLITYAPDFVDNTILYQVIGIGVVFIVFGFAAAKIAAGFISKPLLELEKHTRRIAQKDWKEPINIKSDDEIGRLAEAMNHMQRELRRADEEEKMFLQSISHDLKTPVMVIMSHADAIIDGVYIDSIEETAEIIKDEAIRLEKKIKQMLYLNTLDYVLENKDENSEIRLHDMLLHIINRFEMINSEIEWDLNIDNITINGNTDKLQVAIENILDNGLRYAKEKIRISLKKENSYAVLDIFNDGPKIDGKHIGRIFDNLYKDKTGNFGLGLAISKKIVDFYKGEISAVNREDGVSFIIKYPL